MAFETNVALGSLISIYNPVRSKSVYKRIDTLVFTDYNFLTRTHNQKVKSELANHPGLLELIDGENPGCTILYLGSDDIQIIFWSKVRAFTDEERDELQDIADAITQDGG